VPSCLIPASYMRLLIGVSEHRAAIAQCQAHRSERVEQSRITLRRAGSEALEISCKKSSASRSAGRLTAYAFGGWSFCLSMVASHRCLEMYLATAKKLFHFCVDRSRQATLESRQCGVKGGDKGGVHRTRPTKVFSFAKSDADGVPPESCKRCHR
jgi:hypothetical protein